MAVKYTEVATRCCFVRENENTATFVFLWQLWTLPVFTALMALVATVDIIVYFLYLEHASFLIPKRNPNSPGSVTSTI